MKLQHILESSSSSGYDDATYHANLGLTSLEDIDIPDIVEGSFRCNDNNLTSLKGCPTTVGLSFSCSNNELTSLEGGPTKVVGTYYCTANKLTSLKGAPTSVGNFYCGNNNLTSLEGIHKQIDTINGFIRLTFNPIKSHVLGLLKIKGLTEVYLDNTEVEAIINTHLASGRNVLACQSDLLDAGFEEFAQL